ncbi:uncharacterized protein JCM6883_002549 [Sporobolomyces salmoneus]|uniref:uncharacterized protein n=1 Tax=Sporobolomyces salmoneus TaxID=183962 RepID=UPI0031701E9F
MAPAPRGSASGQKFPCSECEKTFSRKEYMARHYRSKHSKEKPFSCEYCAHGFSRSDLLRRHYKTCSKAKELGVSGPPPGSERAQTSSSGTRTTKRTRTRSASATSPEGPSTAGSPAVKGLDDDDDLLMLPTPPVASTSQSTSPATNPTPLNDLQQSQNTDHLAAQDQHHQRPNELSGMGYNSYYSAPPPHPYSSTPQQQTYPHYNIPSYSNPYSHAQYYHAYSHPQQGYPVPGPSRSTPSPNLYHPNSTSSAPTETITVPSTSDSIAAESLTHYLRQHHESLHQNRNSVQSNPLPPQSTQPAQQTSTLTDTSPSSASVFRPGTATTDTLAPGLSGTGSFSADEVLASEVLRDLMKSPMSVVRPGMSRGDSGDSANGGGGGGGGESQRVASVRNNEIENVGRDERNRGKRKEVSSSSSNAILAGNHQNDWSLMGGLDGFGSSKVNTPIEESPAAIALSSYFNAGGVRGISALDLGFPTEPQLFPDWIIDPGTTPFQDESDRRFEFPEQMFNVAYLYPWHVPPLKTLSQYAKKATETLLPSIPVFHAPSVEINKMALHNAFALTIVGGAYEPEGQSFSNEMLVEKRVFLIRGFLDPSKNWDDRFASLQSLLLYQLLGFFHRDEQQRLLAQQFHTSLIYMFKQQDVPKMVREANVTFPPDDAPTEVVEQAWKDWVKVETWKRVTFIVFLLDLEHSIATGAPQFVQLSDMDLALPCSEFAWSAETSKEWQARSHLCTSHPAMSFLSAVRALLAQSPAPFSEHSIVLAELSRLSSFPLLILARMLSYMEKKCEEALQQVDPFKPLLGGLGMTPSREQENRTMLARIRNGREILRSLPGGMARGGGERWFKDTMPTAFGGAPRRESSTSSTTGSSSSSKSTKTSSPSSADSLNTPPQPDHDTYQTFLTEIELEESYGRNPGLYTPYHSEGGAWPGESYEDAQERLRKLREAKMEVVNGLIPQLPVPY